MANSRDFVRKDTKRAEAFSRKAPVAVLFRSASVKVAPSRWPQVLNRIPCCRDPHPREQSPAPAFRRSIHKKESGRQYPFAPIAALAPPRNIRSRSAKSHHVSRTQSQSLRHTRFWSPTSWPPAAIQKLRAPLQFR